MNREMDKRYGWIVGYVWRDGYRQMAIQMDRQVQKLNYIICSYNHHDSYKLMHTLEKPKH